MFSMDSDVKQELTDNGMEDAGLEEERGGPKVKIEWEGK